MMQQHQIKWAEDFERPFFNFYVVRNSAMIIFEHGSIAEGEQQILETYDQHGFLPIARVTDPEDELFRELQHHVINNSEKFHHSKIKCLILPIRYNQEFLA